jgi:hypothetical protein
MFSPYFEGYIVCRYGLQMFLEVGLNISNWILHNSFNYKVQLCLYLFPLPKSLVLCTSVQFWGHFQKHVWEKRLEFFTRSWGYYCYWIDIPFSCLLTLCPYTFCPWFMQKANLELSTMELVVTRIYGWSSKAFILVVADKLVYNDAHALSFDLELYAQYMYLVKLYNNGSLATMLVKNIGSS